MSLISMNDFAEIMFKETSSYLSKCTIQLFRRNTSEGIVPHGSGILFQFENNYFIISAAHNFIDENKEEIKIRIGKNFMNITNSKLIHSLDTGHLEKDKIDTAILQLGSKTLVEVLKEHNQFIKIEDIELDHKQKFLDKDTSLESDLYILFGYPGKQSKPKYNSPKNWNIKALYLQGELKHLKEKQVTDKGYKNHIFIDKLKKGKDFKTHQKIHIPNLKGMSGCGIWDVQGFDIKQNRQKIKLVGIFIEVNYGYSISSRIDFAVELIRFHFKCSKLPKSSYINNWE